MNKDELVLRIKEAAQTIIDNAESIVGNEKTRSRLSISIDVSDVNELPIISINKDLISEGYLNRIK